MNYPTFLKKVDSVTSLCEKDELAAFVHEIARTLSEDKRERFLSVLESYSSNRGDDKPRKEANVSLEEEIDQALENLDEIKDGDRVIHSEYNEEWDDWDGDWEDEFVFSDPEDVIDDIAEAVLLVHEAIDHEEYEKGALLVLRLSEVEATVYGDYDGEYMGVTDLIIHHLVDVDTKTLLRESLYLTYMGNEEAKRAEAMVSVMDNYESYCVTLEDILESASDEIDLKSFLPSWIEALAARPSSRVGKLLEEAIDMVDDSKTILDTASRYAQSHPELYLSTMRSGLEDAPSSVMLDIGLKAMNEVPVDSDKRSEISLRTAKYALDAGKRDIAQKCWLEAFMSTPSVVNFLRVRLSIDNWSEYSGKMLSTAQSYYSSKFSWDKKPYAAILFFSSRFDEMIEKYMKAGNGIGWSSTFMKEGIALLLMLLLSEGKGGRGMETMRRSAFGFSSFSASRFALGTDIDIPDSDYDAFLECFDKWKDSVAPDDLDFEKWIGEIEKWIELRVNAIMAADKRKYYGECASFIAALGEVEESRGKSNAKQILMSNYRNLYPRRRAFISELESYGMRK